MISESRLMSTQVKLYAYEVFFGEKVSKLRRQELAKLRRNGLNRATMSATMQFIPILAAVRESSQIHLLDQNQILLTASNSKSDGGR